MAAKRNLPAAEYGPRRRQGSDATLDSAGWRTSMQAEDGP